MPRPLEGESKDTFISRCIGYVSKEKKDWEQDQVVAYCYSIWEEEAEEEIAAAFILREFFLGDSNGR